jgi:hypothetical protein
MHNIIHLFHLSILLIVSKSSSNVDCSLVTVNESSSTVSKIFSQISEANGKEVIKFFIQCVTLLLREMVLGHESSGFSVDPPPSQEEESDKSDDNEDQETIINEKKEEKMREEDNDTSEDGTDDNFRYNPRYASQIEMSILNVHPSLPMNNGLRIDTTTTTSETDNPTKEFNEINKEEKEEEKKETKDGIRDIDTTDIDKERIDRNDKSTDSLSPQIEEGEWHIVDLSPHQSSR